MDKRILVVFHGNNPEEVRLPEFRRIQFETLVQSSPSDQPWLGLMRAGLEKRSRELDGGFQYDRCIAIHNLAFKEREFRMLAVAEFHPTIILSERVRSVDLHSRGDLQRASPYMFAATSMGFARMAEFHRSTRFNPPHYNEFPEENRFYQHIKALGYFALGVV